MAKIISVANQKGGMGKPTTAINLAAGLAKACRTILVVDIDPQCNAISGLGVSPASLHPLVADKLLSEMDHAPRVRGAWNYTELVMEVMDRE